MHKTSAALMVALCLTAPATAAPAIWKVSDADSAVWLFGSVHMLRPETQWRTPNLDKLISKVDRVYFEADISTEGQMQIFAATLAEGFNSGGVMLSDIIGVDLTDQVRNAAYDYDIPMPTLLTMKPWLAATTLSAGPLLQSGYDANYGVEMVLSKLLPSDRIGFLETGEEQLGFLAGGSQDEQITMLEATLQTLDRAEADIDAMVEAWMQGDPEGLGAVFEVQMTDFDDRTVDRIIDTRNRNWADKIALMLDENETALLVVGAAHLAGEVSVVRLLEERGFSSDRVQ